MTNTIEQTAAENPALAGDFARIAMAIRNRIAGDFPEGCTLDGLHATIEDGRCVLTITMTIGQPAATSDARREPDGQKATEER